MKNLLGETNAEEKQQVEAWLAAHENNAVYYNQLQSVWEKSRLLLNRVEVDENAAWADFRKRVRHIPPGNYRKIFRLNLRVAAMVAVFLLTITLAYFLLYKNREPAQDQLVQSNQQVLNDTLSDGSVVILNRASTLAYPEKFGSKQRHVTLTGEAFFKVTPRKNHPFVITVNKVEVKVLGTSFNIKSRNGKTEVIVETGRVEVTHNGSTAELEANEKMVIYDTGFLQRETEPLNEQLYKYYRTHEFVCDETPLWKLVEVLNEAYDAKIVIGRKQLNNLKLTTTFANQSLEQVLQVIHLTFDITITRNGNRIILE